MQLRHIIGLTLLISAVPLQMYLMKYNQEFRDLVSEIVKTLPVSMQELTIDLTEYVVVMRNYLKNIYYEYFDIINLTEDTQSTKDQETTNHKINDFRPPHLEYRIGDVVLTRNMILGVIVGWAIDKDDLTKEPEYFLLTHQDLMTESQNHMIRIENIEINNDKISKYFESYDGFRYIPNETMKKLYPKD
ncbi:uncharacterized protein LOC112679784 isoform X2 [Sipha flava]|uniref:Uncharacterized protein LOC112679784 isoform X2 n=1 Tax=Sipha flava TaxID=143950 RepID=A0A8B8F3W7_9HEMI|nr:uncharacterized protein LOC112679784 isoform X2 [Sipha flava]